MSRAKRVFKLIAHKHPNLLLCKNRLVIVPTEQILRGFILEPTSSKDMVVVWRVVMPLYQPPWSSDNLSYSDGIAYTFVNRQAYQESADQIDSIITPHLRYLRRISHARDFLRHIKPMIRNIESAHFKFCLALTYHRAGDVERAISIMKTLGSVIDQWYASYEACDGPMRGRMKRGENPYEDLMLRTAQKMIADPIGFVKLLDKWQEINVEKFALQPTRLKNSAPKLKVRKLNETRSAKGRSVRSAGKSAGRVR
jgi:hypothetical protein